MGRHKQIGAAVVIMALIAAAAILLTYLSDNANRHNSRLNIVASFYPVYSASLRVTQGVKGVKVSNLTPGSTGCLHNYQLTPDNMVTLKNADILIKNGLGMESFLDDIEFSPRIGILDTSEGAQLIGEEDRDRDHDHGDYNQHIWMGPSNYIKQIENIRDFLIKADPEYAKLYENNAQNYIAEIEDLKNRLIAAVRELPTRDCIIFHDSLCYFASELGLNPIASLSLDESSAVSAGKLAEASETAQKAGRVILLYDSQYDAEYNSVAAAASLVRVLKLDTAVVGKGKDDDAWLDAMRNNLEEIREAAN